MYPLKYWFKIVRILFALSINEETGSKKSKEPHTAKTTASVTEPIRTTVTSTPAPPVSTTTTIAPSSLNILPPATTAPTVLTPSAQDVRVGWIYNISKADLQREMQKFNLETRGTVDELRRTFRDFLRQGYVMDKQQPSSNDHFETSEGSGLIRSQDPLESGGAAYREMSNTAHSQYVFPPGDLESTSVREMLRLPPDTDFKEVQRKLSLLLENASLNSRPPPGTSAPSTRTHTTQSIRQPSMSVLHHDCKTLRTTENPPLDPKVISDVGNVCNQVRKWNLRFDGNRDPVSFLERLNELIEAYEIDHDSLLKALPELFKGQALYWYRNNKNSWNSYDDFIQGFEEYFLPPDYRRNLEEEIVRRTQGEHEPFRNFVVALNMLMRRLGSYSTNDLLNRLYRNMRPEYKLTIRRDHFHSVSELMKLAEGYESYIREKRNYRPPPPPAQTLFPEAAFFTKSRTNKPFEIDVIETTSEQHIPRPKPEAYVNKASMGNKSYQQRPSVNPEGTYRPQNKPPQICWNCEKVGHKFFECKLPKRIRCYNCKAEGVRTVHCPCVRGNEPRDQRKGGALSLETTKNEQPPLMAKLAREDKMF